MKYFFIFLFLVYKGYVCGYVNCVYCYMYVIYLIDLD